MAWAFKSDACAAPAVPGQPERADPRAELQGGGGRGRVQQGARDQPARQPGRSQPPARSSQFDALTAVRELFHVGYWLARTYARGASPAPGLAFDASALPRTAADPEADHRAASGAGGGAARAGREALGAAGRQVGARRGAEAAARRGGRGEEGERGAAGHARLLGGRDPRLLHRPAARRRPAGRSTSRATASSKSPACPTHQGKGFVDYVLWGDDGMPLALVEAKRTKKSAQVGQQQAKLYADCLEQQFGRRPVIFYSNGYEHWLWDDASYPPRAVQGFLKKAELELMIQRRTSRKPLCRRAGQQRHRRALLPDARHPPHRRGVRAGPRAQGAGGHGDRRGQDAHGHRAVRSAHAVQLGQARPLPRRSRGAGEPGGQRLQEASARLPRR